MTLNKYEITLGNRSYKIFTPDSHLEDFFVLSTDVRGAIILGNEHSLELLANLLLFSAKMKDSIVFIKCKKNKLTEYLLNRWSIKEKGNDLVLVHHSNQLKSNDWKDIRGLINKTKNHNKEVFDIDFDFGGKRDLSKYWYREHKDYLDIKEVYETLFLVGSEEVFTNISIDAISIKNEGRDLFKRHPGYHAHEHIDYYERRQYTKNFQLTGWSLCLDFYDSKLWEEMNFA
jgi:hypothetical protein